MGAETVDLSKADFSGWATKADLKCTDGRTIQENAFAHQDKMQVPLVWNHGHNDVNNVLGHAILENRPGGVWCYGFFNESEAGKAGREVVRHGDVEALSIFAGELYEKAKRVIHGAIREVSLVLKGANPGALIQQVAIAHSDGSETLIDDEVIIFAGDSEIEYKHDDAVAHADTATEDDEETVADIYMNLDEKTRNAVDFLIAEAAERGAEGRIQHAADGTTEPEAEPNEETTPSEDEPKEDEPTEAPVPVEPAPVEVSPENETPDDEQNNNSGDLAHTHQEGNEDMTGTRSIFERNGVRSGVVYDEKTLAHAAEFVKQLDVKSVVNEAQENKTSFKEVFLKHAQDYGITDIDILFPDAKNVTERPELIARRTEWVAGVIDGAKHTPFSRIKSVAADLTADEARAKGYVKGNLKKEEIIKLLKRVTTPKTIYKKQKLDREDIIDITDLDVVTWLKWEMRFMLEEELARAILFGDGREPDDEDKIDEDHLRPIAHDVDMYNTTVNLPSNNTPDQLIEAVIRARKHFKGTGRPDFYTTEDVITDMLLIKDKLNRYVYEDEVALARKLRVGRLVAVEAMESQPDILGVMVNIADYTIGADRGGQLAMFDDFDIDYNQYKYLIETRISGALTKPKSAVTLKRTVGTGVVSQAPAFNNATNALTVPTVAGLSYFDVTDIENETELTDGEVYYLTATVDIEARADSGYSLGHNTDNDWTYAYNSEAPAAPGGEPTLPS